MRSFRIARRGWWLPSVVAGVWLGGAAPALAHGPVPEEPPSLTALLLEWTFPPLVTLGILVAGLAWWAAIRRIRRRHPANPVPRSRSLAIIGALAVLGFALASGIERYDTTLFWVHMVQHVLLVLVVAPLVALAAPVTVLLRVAGPGTRRVLVRVLRSRPLRVLASPVTAWLIFAGVMWLSHFSGLFDAALEDPLIHEAEHALFLASALLFWWPVVGLDPAPHRLGFPARIGYTFLQMTQNTFLAVVILNAPGVLFPHYATLGAPYGLDALTDQRAAAGIMWLAGDAIFLTAIMLLVAAWMRADARGTRRSDRIAAMELARIRVRERELAERLGREHGEGST